MTLPTYAELRKGTYRIHVRITPNASNDTFAGIHDNRLRIRLSAPAVDGKANQALIRFLSRQWKCSKSAIQIVRGEKSREKTLAIASTIAEQLPSERFE